MKRWIARCWIALFLAAILLPSLQMRFRFYAEFDNLENRELAEFPSLQNFGTGRFAGQLNAYLNDHFGFRPDLIRWNCLLRMRLLGTSPIPIVIPGRDSWLFYCAEAVPDGNTLNDYLGTIPLSGEELTELRQRLEANREAFAQRSIPYLVVIAPNKMTVYGEYLPARQGAKRRATRLDQLREAIGRGTPLPVLDLSRVLVSARSEWPLYYKTDTHWNRFGAYLGYCEIMRKLGEWLPGLDPAAVVPGGVRLSGPRQGGDLAQMLYMQDLLNEENETAVELVEQEEGQPRFGTLVFRHDSFGDALYPYLRRHFNRIVNVAPFAPFDFERIAGERPAAVVHLFVERYITQALHDSFFYPEKPPRKP
jgi:hypothetical protein